MVSVAEIRRQNILKNENPLESSRQIHNEHGKSCCGLVGPCISNLEAIYQSYFHGDLLDVGGGNGRFAVTLLKKGIVDSAIVVDISDLSIDFARQCAKNENAEITCVRCAIEEYETDKRFDLITAFHVLEHVIDCDVVLAKVASLLRPGGVFIGSVPEGNTCDALVHFYHFEVDDIRSLFLKYFKSVEIERKDITGKGEWHLAFMGGNNDEISGRRSDVASESHRECV